MTTVKPIRRAVKAASTAPKKDYAAIAASKITSPQAEGMLRPRIVVYARNKKGKTRFCSTPGKGKVLIVDPEQGTKAMKKLNPDVWPIEKWEELNDLYNYLKSGQHTYEWVALDGMTKIHQFALHYVMHLAEERSLDNQPVLVQKQHYGQAGQLTSDLINRFHNLPMGVIYTAQERVDDPGAFNDEDDDVEEITARLVPGLPKGARESLNQIADVIGRLYVVKIDHPSEDGKILQRRLWVEPSTSLDTGYRSDYVLPTFIKNPTVPKLMQLVNEGKVAARGRQG
jgi:hypothetical protein